MTRFFSHAEILCLVQKVKFWCVAQRYWWRYWSHPLVKPFSRQDQTRKKEWLVKPVFCIVDTGSSLSIAVAKLSIVVNCRKNCIKDLNFCRCYILESVCESSCNLCKLDCFCLFCLSSIWSQRNFCEYIPLTASLQSWLAEQLLNVSMSSKMQEVVILTLAGRVQYWLSEYDIQSLMHRDKSYWKYLLEPTIENAESGKLLVMFAYLLLA